jgi:hypothetical protein
MKWPDPARALRSCGPWVALVAVWTWLYAGTWTAHATRVFKKSILSDDMRIQLPYFYHYRDASLFPNDTLGRYHAEGTSDLFRALYIVGGKGVDIVLLGKLVTYVTLGLTIAGIVVAASRLSGRAAAFAAGVLALGTAFFIQRVAGGLPRSFAYPALAWAAACLVAGWPRTLAVITVIGAGLYPVIPVICGLSLAILLLLVPRADRGPARHWSLRKRLVFLCVTALAAAMLIAPFALRMQKYGGVIRPSDVAAFPEVGDGGRVAPEDRRADASFFDLADGAARGATLGAGRSIVASWRRAKKEGHARSSVLTGLACLTLLGVARLGLARRGRAFRRLAALAVAAFVGYCVAELVRPSLAPPQRYVRYAVPILVLVVTPSVALGFLPRRALLGKRGGYVATLCTLVWGLLLVALLGGRGPDRAGFNVEIERSERGIFKAIGNLPESSLLAGWPRGVLDDVPLVARRTVLVNVQFYQPYHQKMTLEMRRRMTAVVEASFSPERGALLRLRDEFGVTHFVVEPEILRDRPSLFDPLRDLVRRRIATLEKQGQVSALLGDFGRAVIYRDARHTLLDLAKL